MKLKMRSIFKYVWTKMRSHKLMTAKKLIYQLWINLICCYNASELIGTYAIGKPCIRGLRYPVDLILELLSSGMTTEEILEDYDDLEKDDILAALVYTT
jgi:hypothetical protein